MHNALKSLTVRPDFILVDGNRFYPFEDISHECIIQGDGYYRSIAAASILAKTHRDEYMRSLHNTYPHYGWDHNKGYATEFHRSTIAEYGVTPEHRMSFRHVNITQLELFEEGMVDSIEEVQELAGM